VGRLLVTPAQVPVRLAPEAALAPPNGCAAGKSQKRYAKSEKMRTFLYEYS